MLVVRLGSRKLAEPQYLNRTAGGAVENIKPKLTARDLLLPRVWNSAVAFPAVVAESGRAGRKGRLAGVCGQLPTHPSRGRSCTSPVLTSRSK